MKDMWQIWVVVAFYIILMVVIGVRSAKNTRTITDFVVGSRKAGPWMTAFAYGTTYFSAVIFIGYAGRSGFDFGFWAVLIGVANAFIGTFLAWKLLGSKTRDLTRRLKIKTMPQMFEQRYNSKNIKLFSSVVIFVFMVPYSASVYSGLSYLCEHILGVDYILAMAVIAIIAAVYLVLGGYIASLKADLVQGIIMLVGVVAMVFFVVNSDVVGGLSNGLSNLTKVMDENNILSMSPQLIINLIGLCILTSVGSWGMPQMVQKFYGVETDKGVKTGTVISTMFAAVISIGAYFVGSLGRLFFTEVPAGGHDLIVPQILAQTLPALLLGVVLILVLSASVSTLSGITLTSCATISLDLVPTKKVLSKEKSLLLTRVLCLIFIIMSFVLAATKAPILLLMSFSWGTISGSFLAPYILGLWWKKMNKTGAWAGMITGLSVSIILAVTSKFAAANAPVFGVVAMAASFIACIIGTQIGKKIGGSACEVPAKCFDESYTLQVDDAQ